MKVLVLDVGGTYTKFAMVEDFEILWKERVRTPRNNFLDFLQELPVKYGDMDGIVIGFPGIVSREGVVLFSPHIPSMMGRSIHSIDGVPVIVDNDANLFALGEYVMKKDYPNLIGITLGTGVGGGIVLEGKLYRGRGGAGEVGHIIIEMNGPRCDCGNYGCAEAFLGEAYFPRRCAVWFERAGIRVENLDGKLLKSLADGRNGVAIKCWRWYGEKLAVLISNILNILDPDAVALGGGLSKAYDNFSPAMYDNLSLLLGSRMKDVVIYRSQSPEKSTFIGGFKLFMDSH